MDLNVQAVTPAQRRKLKKDLIAFRNMGIKEIRKRDPKKGMLAAILEWDRGPECPTTTNRRMLGMIGIAPEEQDVKKIINGLSWWGIKVHPYPKTKELQDALQKALDEELKLSITFASTNGSFTEHLMLDQS